MLNESYFKFGTELKEFSFESNLKWFIEFSPFQVHYNEHTSYMLSMIAFLFGGIATFLHAFIRGGRLPYLWISIFLHGLVIETILATVKEVDNFWHGQTSIMFLGRRLPLHITLLYPCFTYTASISVAKMRLPSWAEPFAVGLLDTLIDLPYDIVSIRFVHWIWHDTDPNIYDRNYFVPWNSYYFHSTFAAGFTIWFHLSRKLICKKSAGKWVPDVWHKELICSIIPAILGAPTGVLMFIPLYHPLKDLFLVHNEVIYVVLFSIFVLIAWSGDRIPKVQNFAKSFHWSTWILLVYLIFHYLVTLVTVVFFNPGNETSTGFHEPIGNCEETVPVYTPLGMILSRRKYLCLSDYDEKYFNFDCLKNPPSDGSIWYTVCGVKWNESKFENVEYIFIIISICVFAFGVFTNLHFFSYGDTVFDYRENKLGLPAPRKKLEKSKKH